MMGRAASRSGVTVADVLVVLAVLSFLSAAVYPTLRARLFRSDLAQSFEQVDALRRAAEEYLGSNGSWPAAAAPGAIPPELRAAYAGEANLVRDTYTLQWARYEVVDLVEGPPVAPVDVNPLDPIPDSVAPPLVPAVRRIGGVVVHSADEQLLAELIARYGREGSFVRDTIWTLVLGGRESTP